MTRLNTFLHDTTGAVTVDWIVLTAALTGTGLAAMLVIEGGVEDISNDISDEMKRDNGRSIIQIAFVSDGPIDLGGETIDPNLGAYGEVGRTLELSDALGSVSGDNAYVITSAPEDNNGALAGGIAISRPDDALIPGEDYRVSYWARAETGTVDVQSFAYGENQYGSMAPDYTSWVTHTVGEEWTYVEHNYTASYENENFFFATDDLGVTYALDDLKVEKLN